MSDHRKVAQAIEDRFFEEQQLSGTPDIVEWTGLPRSRVDSLVDDMVGNGLKLVYQKEGATNIYLTRDMFNSINAQGFGPSWIEEFEFEEKKARREEIEAANEEIEEYQKLELLLYGSGTPLEDSVEYCLKYLDLQPDKTHNEEDFAINYEDELYVIEVKGVGSKIKKKHVNQLMGWLDKVVEEGADPENLTGVLLHNHDRHTNPKNRDYALTGTAERFLRLRQAIHLSTHTLFEQVRAVKSGDKSKQEAIERLLEGDSYE